MRRREEAWGGRGAERGKVGVLQVRCLRDFVGVPRMGGDWCEEVRGAPTPQLASGVDRRGCWCGLDT